jgi:hypothetical protein
MMPRSRLPSNVPPVTGTLRRSPIGVAPTIWAGATVIVTVKRKVVRISLMASSLVAGTICRSLYLGE